MDSAGLFNLVSIGIQIIIALGSFIGTVISCFVYVHKHFVPRSQYNSTVSMLQAEISNIDTDVREIRTLAIGGRRH
jgi:hypothetical protein